MLTTRPSERKINKYWINEMEDLKTGGRAMWVVRGLEETIVHPAQNFQSLCICLVGYKYFVAFKTILSVFV
jgi:hypothetical protein